MTVSVNKFVDLLDICCSSAHFLNQSISTMSVQNERCCIVSCKHFDQSTAPSSRVYYFKIPALNTAVGKEWAIRLKGLVTKYRGSFLCNLHFHHSDIMLFRRNNEIFARLKADAVPKLMLSNGGSAMNVDSIHQDEEVIQYVDIEAIKKGTLPTKDTIDRPPLTPVIIKPRLSTEISSTKIKLENSKQTPNNCEQCKANEMLRIAANERCRKLEETNQILKQQIKYLIDKVRMQETTVTRSNGNGVTKTGANEESQAEPTDGLTTQCRLDDNDGPNSNEDHHGDRDGDNSSIGCVASEQPPPSNDLTKKAKKKRQPAKKSDKPKVLKLDFVPPDSTFFKCGVCVEPAAFKTSNELKNHMQEMHLSKNKSKLISSENRVQIASPQSTFECYICNLILNKLSDVRQHIGQHVRAQNQKCAVCDERCTAKELNRHMCASSEKSIRCEYCTKSFNVIAKLIQHIESEHEKDKIEHGCNKCSRFFGASRLRDLHEKQHKVVEKLHLCKICDKAFITSDKLASHLWQHSSKFEADSHLCSECGKSFKSASHLKMHSKIHTGKTIKCPECPLVFLNKTKMNYHRETHMDKKFQCNQCSSIFRSRAQLGTHRRFKHSMTEVEKKHACTYCQKRFLKSDKLKVHLRTHSGEKPYMCEYCPRRYAYKQDFKKHLQTHVGDDIYKCEMCDKGFLYHQQKQKHLLEHYKQEQSGISLLDDTQKE